MTLHRANDTARPDTGRRRLGLRPRPVAAVAVALVLVLLAGACGSSGRGDDASSSDESTATSTDGGSGSGEEMFGDLASPCGPGDASGATDQGVTDGQVTIGYGDDAGFPSSPGLNAEMSAAMEAMIQWCNEQGGINGREVVGNYYDAAITEVNNAMTEACQQVFMLVGQGWSLDSAQEQTRRDCGLPSVPGFSVSPAFANAPLMYQPVPNPVDYTPIEIAAAFQEMFPEQIKNSAVMYANYAATIDTKDKVLDTYPEFGFNFLDCAQEYNIGGEADWKPFAQNLKDCGVEVLYFAGSPNPNFQNFLDAANQIGFDPLYITDANFYVDSFAAWNQNGYGDNVYVRMAFTPLFEADADPAVAKYTEIMDTYDKETSLLGMQSTAAFLLWASAAKECGSELTRDCMMQELAKVTEWNSGGLHADTDPANNMPPDCGMVIKLEGTEFVRAFPEGAGNLDCDPSYVAEVTGRVVDQANLDANRIAQLG